MIEVIVNRTGDRAYADTPSAALLAARTLARDCDNGNQGSTMQPSDTVTFTTNGQHVRTVTWAEIRT